MEYSFACSIWVQNSSLSQYGKKMGLEFKNLVLKGVTIHVNK